MKNEMSPPVFTLFHPSQTSKCASLELLRHGGGLLPPACASLPFNM